MSTLLVRLSVEVNIVVLTILYNILHLLMADNLIIVSNTTQYILWLFFFFLWNLHTHRSKFNVSIYFDSITAIRLDHFNSILLIRFTFLVIFTLQCLLTALSLYINGFIDLFMTAYFATAIEDPFESSFLLNLLMTVLLDLLLLYFDDKVLLAVISLCISIMLRSARLYFFGLLDQIPRITVSFRFQIQLSQMLCPLRLLIESLLFQQRLRFLLIE